MKERRLVAIVDDENAVCQAISRLVLSAGFESEIFSSAEGFLRSCRERKPDCLILDLRLPGMSGLELQQQLTTDDCRIPIVFVSAHNDPSSRGQALQSGASAFLGKPFNDDALLEAIHSAMKPNTEVVLLLKIAGSASMVFGVCSNCREKAQTPYDFIDYRSIFA